jgi:glycosyltransferase involved in cell wall biosynthesis
LVARFRASPGRPTATIQKKNARIAIIQGAMPRYRTPVFEELKLALPDQLVVASGSAHFEGSVKSDRSTNLIDIELTNVFFLGRRLLYQRGYRRATRDTETIVLELNPRVINTWLTLIESKLRRRRTVLWGHHLGRRLAETKPRLLRRTQVQLCTALLAYTDDDADRMRSYYPSKNVFVAPNATERSIDSAVVDGRVRTDYLYVGRLTTGKRPGLLLSAFAAACAADFIPDEARLLFVGEGPLTAQLKMEVEALSLTGRVKFVGASFDSEVLNDLYASTVAGVCGGYVGLNITQSLSRGVPFVYPASANHSPEVALARPGVNAFPFDPPDAGAAAQALAEVWTLTQDGLVDHHAIREDVISRYSVESMVAGFLKALKN